MATYLGTHGSKIQNYTTDPDNPNTGEVWFNATDAVLKFQYVDTYDAWSTGGNLNTAKGSLAGAGIQTAALAFGGNPGSKNETELYNGTSWTEVNNLNLGRGNLAGCGTSTAALGFGGYNPPGTQNETET
jgi:hypothetical protein